MYVSLVQNATCKGNFEGMKHHLHLQTWDMMIVGDIETKVLGFKTVLLDLVEKFCPLARSKRPLAKPWLSRHIVAMQKVHISKQLTI